MMTTMAALLGGVPLMLGAGTGAEIRQPLGYAIVGGLIVSQALTLYTTPVVFLYLDRLNAWFTGGSRRKRARIAVGVTHRQMDRLAGPLRVRGGCRPQSNATAGLPPAPEIPSGAGAVTVGAKSGNRELDRLRS